MRCCRYCGDESVATKTGLPVCSKCHSRNQPNHCRVGTYRTCPTCRRRRRIPEQIAARSQSCNVCRGGEGRARYLGFHKCRRCHERKPYPEAFVHEGRTSQTCADCLSHRHCRKCGKRRRVPEEITLHQWTCKICRRRAKAERVKRRQRQFRESYHRRQRRLRLMGPYVPAPPGNHFGTQLDAGPLCDWLRYEFANWPMQVLASWLEEDDRQLAKLVSGSQQKISLHIADRILVKANCPHLLALLYPDGERA